MSALPFPSTLLLAAALAFPAAAAPPPPITEGPAVVGALPAPGAAFRSVPEMVAGYDLLYVQKFTEARERFHDWSRQNETDPFAATSLAASYLFEEFFHQGVMTSDYFLDDDRFLRGIDGEPDAARMSAFREALEGARRLAGRLLDEDPGDADALFALTLAAGMESNALSILEKRNLDGLRRLKESNGYAERLLAVHPEAADAWLALGSANYIIGCLSTPVRFFLWFGGYHGDRALGMEQLERAAADGTYLRPYAKILLALAARREGRSDLARRQLHDLTRQYPGSPLFAAEYALVAAPAGTAATP